MENTATASLLATGDQLTNAASSRDHTIKPLDNRPRSGAMQTGNAEPGIHTSPPQPLNTAPTVSATSEGHFTPSVVNAPAYGNDFSQLSANVKHHSEELVAEDNRPSRVFETLTATVDHNTSIQASNNNTASPSSPSSPPAAKFQLPMTTSVPQANSNLQPQLDWAGGVHPGDYKMLFGELGKGSAASRRRMATTSALTDYEADLTSKDRLKQKEAIRRLLAGKVKNDWIWSWPPSSASSRPSTPVLDEVEENLVDFHWCEREEWASNASDTEDEGRQNNSGEKDSSIVASPYRFDDADADAVGWTENKRISDRKARRRRRLYDEMKINDGVACFTHRRNAWTRARHVRRSKRPQSSNKNLDPEDVSTSDQIDHPEDEWITEIPIPPSILPSETPMRKGINEKAYATIYDKVIVQSQTPFCPINLAVVVRSCVEGWKRDGEWPPSALDAGAKKALVAAKTRKGETNTAKKGVRKDSEGAKDKGVIRRGLQRVLGVVHGRRNSEVLAAFENADGKSITNSTTTANEVQTNGPPIA